MKQLLIFKSILFFTLFSSCDFQEDISTNTAESKSVSGTYSSDLDDDIWINKHTLIKGFGHSGVYCCRLDSINEFSYGFSQTVNDINIEPINYIDVIFWTYFEKLGEQAQFVVSIDSEKGNKFWSGINISDSIKATNEWKEINLSVALPDKLSPEDRIMIYLWNPDKEVFFMDDLSLRFR